MTDRALGWVQDPGKLQTLRTVVTLFSPAHSTKLQDTARASLQLPPNELSAVIGKLQSVSGVTLTFKELVGSKGKRNGLLPAVLPGQRGAGMSTWACDNFLRWGQALGYLDFDRAKDAFSITSAGKQLLSCAEGGVDERKCHVSSLLSYPPAQRLLKLLGGSSRPLTKWELGAELGFVGEDGFTSYSPQRIYDWIASVGAEEAREIRADVEGTSDKYARMVCGWLESVQLVSKHEVSRVATDGTRVDGLLAYGLTGQGQHVLTRLRGQGGNSRPTQLVSWEMLATKPKGETRTWRRNVRAELLLELSAAGKSGRSVAALALHLHSKCLTTPEPAVRDHLVGLQRIGVDVEENGNKWRLLSPVAGLSIPPYGMAVVPREVELDNLLRVNIRHLDHKYLILAQLAYGGRSEAAELERVTAELLTDELGVPGITLGGPHKPDGAVWDDSRTVLIDTKAYSGGYGASVEDQRAVAAYVRALSRRQGSGTEWWDPVPATANSRFGFCFISGSFTAKAHENIAGVLSELDPADSQKTVGLNLAVEHLLTVADSLHERRADARTCLDELFFNAAAA
jgi:hypothetical protein